MIFRRLALALAGACALAASAAIVTVALALALYDLLLRWVSPAASAGLVALAFALVLALAGALMVRRPRPPREPPRGKGAGALVERALAFVREKPAVAIGAALGAGFLAVRNPRYLGAALRAFMEGREHPRGL